MGRLTQKEYGKAGLIINAENENDARKELHDKFLIAMEKLFEYENTDLEPSEIEALKVDIEGFKRLCEHQDEFLNEFSKEKEKRIAVLETMLRLAADDISKDMVRVGQCTSINEIIRIYELEAQAEQELKAEGR